MKISIVDDHEIFCVALKNLLEVNTEFNFESVQYFLSGQTFLDHLQNNEVEFVLLDLNMPGIHGKDVIIKTLQKDSKINIIVLTSYSQTKLVKDCMQLGAAAYILKENTYEELMESIRAVLQGESYLGKGANLFKKEGELDLESSFDLHGDAFHLANKLTRREKEILLLIVDAKTNKQIANQLYISDQTVGVHRKNIMRKLGVNNTASLIKKALELQMNKY